MFNKITLIILIFSAKVLLADGLRKPINYKYRGTHHPETQVAINRMGNPKFKSYSDYKLATNLWDKSDAVQFRKATLALKNKIQKKPELKKLFTAKQLSDIERGVPRIDGLTWHHSQRNGLLQLVDREIHNNTGHSGGRSKWGNKTKRARAQESSLVRKTLVKLTTKVKPTAKAMSILKGGAIGMSKYIPFIGIVAQIAHDISVESRLDDLKKTTTDNTVTVQTPTA